MIAQHFLTLISRSLYRLPFPVEIRVLLDVRHVLGLLPGLPPLGQSGLDLMAVAVVDVVGAHGKEDPPPGVHGEKP